MPIDPRIIGQLTAAQPVQPFNPLLSQEFALRMRQQQQAEQEQGLKTQLIQQQLEKSQQMRSIMQQTGGDLEKAYPMLVQVDPEHASAWLKEHREGQKAALDLQITQLKHHAAIVDTIGSLVNGVTDQASLDRARVRANALGFGSDDLPDVYDPGAIQQLRQQSLSVKEQVEQENKRLELARQTERDRLTGLNIESEIGSRALTREQATATAAETARHNRAEEGLAGQRLKQQGSEDTALALTPAGLDVTAENFFKTGQLPPMGMGKQGAAIRTKIINRAAELHPGMDLASNRAGFQADEGSLKQLQKSRDAISAFENTALKNIDTFLETAGRVVDTGSPMANRIARGVAGSMLGSKNQAAYDAARQVALNEVAKIVSNPNLSGTLSDSARHEVEAFNPDSATLAQSVAVMRVLKRDMANRAASYDAQLAEVKGRISGQKPTPAAPAAPSGGGGALTYQDYLKSRGQK